MSHTLVVGASGSGKTKFLSSFMKEATAKYRQNLRFLVIDPHDSLRKEIGGLDKTNYEDLPEIYEILRAPQVKKIVLIGESGHELAKKYQDDRFILAESLDEAINTAKSEAESMSPSIIVMSPAAASFDMFENVYDRGAKFQHLIKNLENL